MTLVFGRLDHDFLNLSVLGLQCRRDKPSDPTLLVDVRPTLEQLRQLVRGLNLVLEGGHMNDELQRVLELNRVFRPPSTLVQFFVQDSDRGNSLPNLVIAEALVGSLYQGSDLTRPRLIISINAEIGRSKNEC